MTVIFKCETNNAYVIKVLAELLQSIIKTACFEVDEKGIKLSMLDHTCDKTILTVVNLDAENFTKYKFTSSTPLYLGINLNHLHKMLKSIKKKESLKLYIDDKNPTDLAIVVIPKENTRTTTSIIKIQNIQCLDFEIPTGYGKPILISSSEYMKMIKEMLQIGSAITINSFESYIEFKCNIGGILQRNVQFGELPDDDDEVYTKKDTFSQTFDTEQLSRITKISGLSTQLQIYATPNLPLLIKSNISTLGKIFLYIKSKEQKNLESCNINSDDE